VKKTKNPVTEKIKKKLILYFNNFLTITASEYYDLIHVVEYPKCGATWVSRLIATYIGIDRKYGGEKILKKNSVIQKHALYNRFYKKVVLVIRDPGDVWVSFYFHEMYHQKDKKLMNMIDFVPSQSDQQNLFKYVENKIKNPHLSTPGFSYREFVESWFDKKNIYIVSYEELQRDTEDVLSNIIRYLGYDIVPEKIKQSVERHSFSNVTKRQKGEEDKFSHTRKGIVGDWKNYFTPEVENLVHEYQGKLLIKLNYD